jgi:hypothetical protein
LPVLFLHPKNKRVVVTENPAPFSRNDGQSLVKALSMSDDLSMNAYNSKFHDGFLDGFLIREPQVIIFLRMDSNEAFVLIADDVTSMRADILDPS